MKKKVLKLVTVISPIALIGSTGAALSSCSVSIAAKVDLEENSSEIISRFSKKLYMLKENDDEIKAEFKSALFKLTTEQRGEGVEVFEDEDFIVDYSRMDSDKLISIISLAKSKKIKGQFQFGLFRDLECIRLDEIYLKEEENDDETITDKIIEQLINEEELIDQNDFENLEITLKNDGENKNKKIAIITPKNTKPQLDKDSSDYIEGKKEINVNFKVNISKIDESLLKISEYLIRGTNSKNKEEIANILRNVTNIDGLTGKDIDSIKQEEESGKDVIKVDICKDSKFAYGQNKVIVENIPNLDPKWFNGLVLTADNEKEWKTLIENKIRENNKDKTEGWFEDVFKNLQILDNNLGNLNSNKNRKSITILINSQYLKGDLSVTIFGVYDLSNKEIKEEFDKKFSNNENFENIKEKVLNFIRAEYIKDNSVMPFEDEEFKKQIVIDKEKDGNRVTVNSKNSLIFKEAFQFELVERRFNLSNINSKKVLNIPSNWFDKKDKDEFKEKIEERILEEIKNFVPKVGKDDFEIDLIKSVVRAKDTSKILRGEADIEIKQAFSIESVELPQISTLNENYVADYFIHELKTSKKIDVVENKDFEVIKDKIDEKKSITIKSLEDSEKICGELEVKYIEIIDIGYLEKDDNLPSLFEGDEKYQEKIVKFIDKYFGEGELELNKHYTIEGSNSDTENSIRVVSIPNNGKIIGLFAIPIRKIIDISKIDSIKFISITKNTDKAKVKKEAISKINEYKNQNEDFKKFKDINENDLDIGERNGKALVKSRKESTKIKGEIEIFYTPLRKIDKMKFADEIAFKRYYSKDNTINLIIEYLRKELKNPNISEKDIKVNQITEQSIKNGIIYIEASEDSEFIEGKNKIEIAPLLKLQDYAFTTLFPGGISSKEDVRKSFISHFESFKEFKDEGIKIDIDYRIDFEDTWVKDENKPGGRVIFTVLKNDNEQRLFYDEEHKEKNTFWNDLPLPNISDLVKKFKFIPKKRYFIGSNDFNFVGKDYDLQNHKFYLAKWNVLNHINASYNDSIVKFDIPKPGGPKDDWKIKPGPGKRWWADYLTPVEIEPVPKKPVEFKFKGENKKDCTWEFVSGYISIRIDEKVNGKLPFKFEKYIINDPRQKGNK